MKIYKVWVSIECYDDKSGDGWDVGLPELLAEYEEDWEAQDFVQQLMDTPIIIHSDTVNRDDKTVNLHPDKT